MGGAYMSLIYAPVAEMNPETECHSRDGGNPPANLANRVAYVLDSSLRGNDVWSEAPELRKCYHYLLEVQC